MANYQGKNYASNSRKKKSGKYTEIERFAYNMGRVNLGLSNPNSRVKESYDNGKKRPTKKEKKPLF